MIVDTNGLVLRQIKTVNGRRMILLFTEKYGKVGVGSNLTEGGKNKTALLLRPFVLGRYELFKGRESYNLNGGQVLKSHFSIGDNVDKYLWASYVLELTEKVIPDNISQPRIFRLLCEFLEAIEKREKKQETIVLAYMVKLLDYLGSMPSLEACTECGEKQDLDWFSVKTGGMLCSSCRDKIIGGEDKQPLIYKGNFGIVNILKYFKKEPFSSFERIALDDSIKDKLMKILKSYYQYHHDIGKLKSEVLSLEEF